MTRWSIKRVNYSLVKYIFARDFSWYSYTGSFPLRTLLFAADVAMYSIEDDDGLPSMLWLGDVKLDHFLLHLHPNCLTLSFEHGHTRLLGLSKVIIV